MESVGISRGRVLGAGIKDTSCDSAHTDVIEGMMMWYRLSRIPEVRSGMDSPIAADGAEEVQWVLERK